MYNCNWVCGVKPCGKARKWETYIQHRYAGNSEEEHLAYICVNKAAQETGDPKLLFYGSQIEEENKGCLIQAMTRRRSWMGSNCVPGGPVCAGDGSSQVIQEASAICRTTSSVAH